MLARRILPDRYEEWNRTHGAPFGHDVPNLERLHEIRDPAISVEPLLEQYGAFCLQWNNTTRFFEYPWIFEQIQERGGKQIVEVGGGVSGLQFTLAAAGATVRNVDPGGAGYDVDDEWIRTANKIFGVNVEHLPLTLQEARFPSGAIDTVVSVSTLEHLPVEQIYQILLEARRILAPGGSLILTVDLFLNCHPFSDRRTNEFGTNVPIWQLLHDCGFYIEAGLESELFSSPSFNAKSVMCRLDEFLIGQYYPAMAQLMVARSA